MKCENCIHYGVCVVNSYCHEPCGYYEEERPQWIPCSERLPEAGTPVIYCNHHGEVTFGERFRTQGKAFIDFFTSNLTFATAWMPLPKPYEKEGDRNENCD